MKLDVQTDFLRREKLVRAPKRRSQAKKKV